MAYRRKLSALVVGVLAILLGFAIAVPAFARELVDMNRTGSISLSFTYNGRPVAGGSLALYRVGSIQLENGDYSYVLTGDFAGSRFDLDNLESASLAQNLADYAEDNDIEATRTATIGSDGKVTVSDLELGLYLIVQTRAASGYEPISPFLVSVPLYESGTFIYDVDATPKMEPVEPESPGTPDTPGTPGTPDTPDEPDNPDTPESPESPESPSSPDSPDTPESPENPDSPSTSDNPDTPEDEDEPKLPQTGTLMWVVPLLVVAGGAVFVAGRLIMSDKKSGE